jgi:hypothetical protein
VASQLTALEVQRALIRLGTTGEASPEQLEVMRERFDAILQRVEQCSIDDVTSRAGERFPAEPVRSLDAIHLATVAEVGREEQGQLTVCTYDARMHANAKQMGFAVLPKRLPVRKGFSGPSASGSPSGPPGRRNRG